MSETSFLKRRWKMLLNILTVAALLVLVYAIRHQLADTVNNLAKVNAWALLLIVPIEVLNYHSQAKLYQGLFALVGNKLKYKFLVKASLELNFINHVFPSGGVSGISYFGARMRSDNITGGKATLVQMMKLILGFVSFEALLIIGLLFMAIGGRVNDLVILVATALSTLLVVGTCGFVFIIGSQKRINAFFTTVMSILNKIIQVVRPKHPETIKVDRVEMLFTELHQNYKLIESQYRSLRKPLVWAFMMNLTEVLAVYVVFLAFGHWVNFGSVVLAYAVANFAGLVSVLPGGVGIYEALMTAVLAAAGVPAGLSLPVIVMYRVVNTLIQLPPGYVYYHRTLHAEKAEIEHEHE
ncbi:MAG TPA: lysylphosphatidylglycerol synthase transmembrane domain-containing protein [Candidatus Saccharimonadales bacterium]|nr:lysylphosphatidylglycerol synthase transmembrane domain-containing protein [Candidatus Saccharimonadales bacterium]